MNWIIAGAALCVITWICFIVYDHDRNNPNSLASLVLGLVIQIFGALMLYIGVLLVVPNDPITSWLPVLIPVGCLVLGMVTALIFRKVPLPASFLSVWTRMARFFFPHLVSDDPNENKEEEIEKLLDTSSIEDLEDQREVIENALDLGDTTLDQICTHRSNMVCLSMKDDPSKWRQVILNLSLIHI